MIPRCWPLAALALGLAATAAAGTDVHVSAYYYPWYSDSGRHWDLGYDGKGTHRGPALGEYSSRSAEAIRQQIAWSRDSGIDTWIGSWWGPDSWEDETLRRHVLPRLEETLADRNPVTLCLLYETEGLLGLDPERGIEFTEKNTAAFGDHFRHLSVHYFSHPAYHRIDGRPVVYLYLSRAFAGDYARALVKARAVAEARGFRIFLVGDEVYWGEPEPRRIAAFDAVTAYNLHGPGELRELTDWSAFAEACEGVFTRYRDVAAPLGVGLIPGILPGFDTGGRNYSIPRALRPGAGPDSTFEALGAMALRHLDARLNAVAITSFNEWHEGTQIEPGATTGAAIRRIFKPSPQRR